MLTKYGQAVTITRQTTGAYDPATGSAAIVETTQTGVGALFDFETAEIDGTLIQQNDKKLLLNAIVTAPLLNDKFTVNTIIYTVVNIKELNPAGTAVMFELALR
jgi:hypothetical protein